MPRFLRQLRADRLLATAALLLSLAFSACARKPAGTPAKDIFGTSTAAFFAPGEPIRFSFDSAFLSALAPTSTSFTLCWRRTGDDGRTESGRTALPTNSIGAIDVRLDFPGFVQLAVTALDDAGNVVFLPGQKRPPTRFGAGVCPEAIEAEPEPPDFDAFWNRQKAKLAAEPLAADQAFLGVTNGMRLYAVRLPCPDNVRPATGYLAIPADARPRGLSARVGFQGYGTTPQEPDAKSWERGWIYLVINAHGYELGRDSAYYDDFFRALHEEQKGEYAFNETLNGDPETAYFHGMSLRVARTLEFVKTLPEWNGKVLEVRGSSQGGLQACWAAGLDRDISHIRIGNVWCCNLAGTRQEGRLAGNAPAFTPALAYYDPVYHARRFHAKKLRIFSAALGDEVCPPAGQALLYRNASVRNKSINWFQGASHQIDSGTKHQVFQWKNGRTGCADSWVETAP